MRVLLCGGTSECEHIKKLFSVLPFKVSDVIQVSDYEEIHRCIVDYSPEIAIVCPDGASGMECVYRINESANIPVFWFSNDKSFALQSYRMGCKYFSVKPVTEDSFKKAFSVLL